MRPFTQYDEGIQATQADNPVDSFQGAGQPSSDPRDLSSSCGGVAHPTAVNYPLPPDVNAPNADKHEGDEISDFGINESVEVGCGCSVQQYGLVSGEGSHAGSDDSVAGYGTE